MLASDLRVVERWLSGQGASVEDALQTAGIPMTALTKPRSRIPTAQVGALLKQLSSQYPAEDIGLALAQHHHIMDSHVLGITAISSETGLAALQRLCRYQALVSTHSPLQIIEEAEGNAWFQLYAGQSDDETYALVERAQNSGYQTLILTADVPALPARPRDYRNGFAVPFSMRPNHFVDFACHPKWSLQTLINGIPSPKNVAIQKNNDQPGFRRESGRDRIDWDFLSELRTRWKGNLVLKGVMSCEDAKRATAANVDAVYVSNHGGRQLESAPAAISRLSKIRTVLGDDTSVLFDSGVRNGDDVARALATGADFVMLGRPILYALAGRGEGGLNEFLRLLIDEFSIVMAQLGCTEPAQINHECIASKD